MEPNVAPKKRSSSLLYILLLVILALIGYGAYVLVNKESNTDKQNNDTNNESVDENTESETETDTDTNTNTDTDSETTDSDTNAEPEPDTNTDTTVVDFTSYKTTKQTVGSSDETDGQYTLSSLTDTANTGFHRFEFTLTRKTDSDVNPYVTATYIASLGAIRIDFAGVTTDNSGIGYQKSRMINKEGVIKIYHNVSADQTEELYDIGVSKETPFLFSMTGIDASSWLITLDVKYPGVVDTADVDLGSEEFSKDAQTITGAGKADGAKVSSYSYSASGGILRIVFEVKGSTAKPIPSASAGYDGDNLLTLRFTDISEDVIAKMPAALDMPGGITMVWEMEGSSASKYTFDGAAKEFKLSAGTSPNQVILEIKL
ncbi:MAG: hypothetical protein UT34_C0002G0223 [candidate division WS6 bacterium GW2011_GWF2_39_15]|uniref:Uncharacterized protein n=1 Tax=candidate division WS6 bacterium GW2011_GWF2_39_15 TaxID=1619100 RepID=A0A0G0MYU6_9BACT|nr:MAG: hypothetical protein UT34_C0002G0223 [candidate division WS6 bacterium GW2011_GWF2_39_15]